MKNKMSIWTNNFYTVTWYEKDGNIVNFDNVDLLESIGSLSEKLDPRNSAINTATLDFSIINSEDRFSKFLYDKLSTSGKMFFREVVEIKKANYTIYKGFIRSIKLKDTYETKYSIQLETVIGKLKTSLWDREFAEYLAETVDNINSKRLSQGFRMEERVKNSTVPVGEQEKYRVIIFEGHIMDCLKGIFQMVLSKPDIGVNTLFLDNNYENFLDLENWQSIKNSLSSLVYTSYFEWKEPISNIFEFIQSQIFAAIGVLPVIDRFGKLQMVIHQQPTVSEGIKTFTHDEIIKLLSKNIDESQIVNNIKIKYNYDLDENEYTKAVIKVNSSSFQFFGNELIPEKPQELEIKSINKLSRANQLTFINNIGDLLFARYSREINTISIRLPIQLGYELKLGEFIGVETNILVDWETGTRGFSEGVDTAEPIAKFDLDDWGGFIQGNSLGMAPNGYIVIDTDSSKISLDLFRGAGKSFINNHKFIKEWVTSQIG